MQSNETTRFEFDLQLFADGADASGSGEGGAGGAQGDPANAGGEADPAKTGAQGGGENDDPALGVDESKLDPHVKLIINDYKRNLKEAQKNASAAQKIADDAKKAADAAIASANDAKKKLTAKEEAELAEQKKWQDLAEKRAEDARLASEAAEKRFTDQEKAHKDQLDEYNNGLILEAVARAAEREGITDPDDIELPVFTEAMKLVKVERGRVVGAKDAVAKMREIKPAKFKATEEGGSSGGQGGGQQQQQNQGGERGADGKFIPAKPNAKPNTNKDASRMNADEFAELEARLRRGVA